MFKVSVLIIALAGFAPVGFGADRFSGHAELDASNIQSRAVQSKANQRFSVVAELRAKSAMPKTTATGRFSLLAEFSAPKSALTACGPLTIDVFKNGFEN